LEKEKTRPGGRVWFVSARFVAHGSYGASAAGKAEASNNFWRQIVCIHRCPRGDVVAAVLGGFGFLDSMREIKSGLRDAVGVRCSRHQ